MASKYNAAQKATDSTIRAFNAQIERAYKTLGANNTITQNLVNTARSIYGASGMREMKIRPHGVVGAMVNPVTGEVSPIPQIARTKENVNNAYKAKQLRARTQYTSGSRNGQYKFMFDVTRAHQKAIKQVRQNIVKSFTPQYRRNTPVREIQNEINRQMTNERIQNQQLENDLASEIFAKYELMKSTGYEDDDPTLITLRDMANEYHNNGRNIPDTDLWNMAASRSKILGNKGDFVAEIYDANNPRLTGEQLKEYLDGFEEIYNPF